MKVLKWPGSKWNMSNKIIELMPPHTVYIEPFFGSGAVFFNKKRCNLEILNDLDSEVVNLFKVIRDYPGELADKVFFTPYSREEYKETYDRYNKDLDDLEKARQFLVRSNMARAGMQYYSSSWRTCGLVLASKIKQRVTREWNRIPDNIFQAALRLKDAEIENIDAIKLIKKYNGKNCLIYVDPPYLLSTRKQKYYNVEMTEENEHKELISLLKQHKGPVILSGYNSNLYNNLLKDWNKIGIKTNAEQGKKRVEVIWTNYEIPKQVSMFR